jgi:hypothetical protein
MQVLKLLLLIVAVLSLPPNPSWQNWEPRRDATIGVFWAVGLVEAEGHGFLLSLSFHPHV